MKKKYTLILLSIILFLSLALAPKASADQSYIVHLYYNTKTKALYFDKMQHPVDLDKNQTLGLKEFFDNQDTIKSADYILKIKPSSGEEMEVMKFNKKAGQFDLTIPYFVSGQTINIYNFKTGEKIISTDISSFKVCNGNNICEYEKGENALNCISDCANEHIVYSDETRKALKEHDGTIKDPVTGDVVLENKAYSSSSQKSQSSLGGSQGPSFGPPPDSTSGQPTGGNAVSNGNVSKIIYIGLAILLVIVIAFSAVVYFKKRNQ